MSRRILLTCALPYANGPIHVGHLVEHVQGDVFARFQRLRGHDVLQVCGDDAHGTATMIRARQEGRSEEDLVAEMNAAHRRDFEAFGIHYDQYGTTHAPENEALCHRAWEAFRRAEMVVEREVTQLFDPVAGLFLADRFVRGTCPRCGTADQYGDSCSSCGAVYSPTDLSDAISTLSGAKPELRTASHLFVRIERLRDFLTRWVETDGHVPPGVANYLTGHFLGSALQDWDVSRPAPYFGFEIPGHPGHHFYVWFDAPLGYVSNTQILCEKRGLSPDAWWNSRTEIVHVIGKDIVYFHCLFWPAMLKTVGLALPRRIQVHGMLTVDGEKMSKSKGTFITAEGWARQLPPEPLRYFLAAKLSSRADDFDLGLDEFVQRVNGDLVGKVVNLASRTARFLEGQALSEAYPDDGGLFQEAARRGESIAEAYESFDSARAVREILALADRANEYVERQAPWALKKRASSDAESAGRLRDVCTVSLNLYRQIALYLAPILPDLARRSGELLGAPMTAWEEAGRPLLGVPIGRFQPLLQRVERTALDSAGSVASP